MFGKRRRNVRAYRVPRYIYRLWVGIGEGYGVVERELLAATHRQISHLVVKLLELERFENVVELARGIGVALRTPPIPESSSDETMEETNEERMQRYRDSEQCEVSDPDLWATVHYGPPEDGENETNDDDPMDAT